MTTAQLAAWIHRFRRREAVDGVWIRVHDDGMLELRDPNSGLGWDPEAKPRHQYRLDAAGSIETRRLPPAAIGDAWVDIGVPEWEPYDTPPPSHGIVYDWRRIQVR